MPKQYWLYIMTNRPGGTLYVGTTSSLAERIQAHKDGRGAAFVRKYNLTRLVYAEAHPDYEAARTREARVKKWRRDWKVALIERDNPDWRDISNQVL